MDQGELELPIAHLLPDTHTRIHEHWLGVD